MLAPPQKPRATVRITAVRPDRDALEVQFPRVHSCRAELLEERLTAEFNSDSILEITLDLIGPSTLKMPA
ncbi:hypothetical protein METHB2_80064 [Candidatus Methylobacter favarea]|uniref:Uncharacterized protein n=1 Tax=Candidatus Methylobacter favarea TaxID=2707345 RepID=A0A8S0YAY0_9GAMM|nr:hypothetical protein [Candidatus Methylobacter favarea]CAA9892747.1 hypothetical protein METHB2_80064 [Candidatus Methylobacter favarea]